MESPRTERHSLFSIHDSFIQALKHQISEEAGVHKVISEACIFFTASSMNLPDVPKNEYRCLSNFFQRSNQLFVTIKSFHLHF
ncbi:hypothetical protein GDO81_009351 [Engystomops pustulosus]|uniref:Uncharacterized protein n=1 Tax=Engystomops pustulosus TaxID=76066 RepID=A0AAV7BQ26_ENGPU|nr:hypothetical protein GDO81_009351 [Engystomops pustulosus]